MYKITSNTRRVTQRMIDEAYKWLYRKIRDGGYNMNRCLEGESLVISMQEAGCVDQHSYERFIALTETRPFFYMLSYKESPRKKKITSNDILNYFVEFNGYTFPLGFLMDFFEDDYETREEIDTFVAKYINSEKEMMIVQFKKELVQKNINHEKLMSKYPNVFRTKPGFFIFGALKLLALGVLMFLFFYFLNTIHFFPVMERFFKTGMQFDGWVIAPLDDVTAYLSNDKIFTFDGTYTFAEYFVAFLPLLLSNAALLCCTLVGRFIKAICWLISFAFIMFYRAEIMIQNQCVKYLEKTGFAEIQEYFDTVIDELCETKLIADSTIESIPKARLYYLFITNFNTKIIANHLDRITYCKLFKNVGLSYLTEEESYSCRYQWYRGLRMAIVWIVLYICLDIPAIFSRIINIFPFN